MRLIKRSFLPLTALAMVAMIGAQAPSSAARPHALTIRGTTTGYTDIELHENVQLECCTRESRNPRTGQLNGLHITTEGSYAGLVIERLSNNEVVFAGFRLPSFDDVYGTEFTTDIEQHQIRGQGPQSEEISPILPPGRYRVYLFADGRSTARLDISDLHKDLRLTPMKSVVSRALLADLDVRYARQREDLRTSPRGFGLAVVLARTDGNTWVQDICFTKKEGDCTTEDDDYRRTVVSGIGTHSYVTLEVPRGSLPANPAEALVTVVNPGTATDGALFVLVAN